MATVAETIAQGREQVEQLRLQPFERTQLMQTFTAIERAVTPAREQVSLALTLLRDPAGASRLAHIVVVTADMLDEALGYLNGTREPQDEP